MYDLLAGLRAVEISAFVAGPTCGLYLAQMGAEVIRVDAIGGGPDFRRWPLADSGESLYWEGLNKAKKSVALDLARPEGRELAQRLAAEARDRGIVHFTALVRSDNAAVRRLLARIAATLEDESVPEHGVRALTVGLAA